MQKKLSVCCPYCGEGNETDYHYDPQFKVVYVCPNKLMYSTSVSQTGFFVENCPNKIDDIKELQITCRNPNCQSEFSVKVLSADLNDNRIKPKCRYYLNLLEEGKVTKINKGLIEESYDFVAYYFYKFFYIIYKFKESDDDKKSLLLNFFVSSLLVALLTFLPLILIGYSQLISDGAYFILLIPTALMVTLVVRHCKNVRNYIDDFPFDFHDTYLKTNSYIVTKELYKGWIFGYPYKIGYATIIGILLFFSMFITTVRQSYYSVYALYLSLFSLLIFFVILYAVYISFKTMIALRTMLSSIPLKINLLEENGGLEVVGKIISSSLLLLTPVTIFFGTLIVFWVKTPSINQSMQNTILASNSSLIPYLFGFGYSLLLIIMYISPIFIVHNKMKAKKQKELKELLNNFPYENIKKGTDNNDAHNVTILKLYDKISDSNEWPYGRGILNIMIGTIIYILIPIFGIIIALIQLTK